MSRSIRMMVTSGNGPAECRIAVGHVLEQIGKEGRQAGLSVDVVVSEQPDKHGPSSAIVVLEGQNPQEFSKGWIGTVQWVAQSPVRKHHRRRNWFVGVLPLSPSLEVVSEVSPAEVRFESFRAGGPGGQHQNTTDSAVRAVHIPTGVTSISRDQRSQHRNKAVALARIGAQLALSRSQDRAMAKSIENQMHNQLERGNPVRKFKGGRFLEVG